MGSTAISPRSSSSQSTSSKLFRHSTSSFVTRLFGCTRPNSQSATNFRRLRDLPAIDMLDTLAAITAPSSTDEIEALIQHIASTRQLLHDVISLANSPPLIHKANLSPRQRLPHAWLVSSLIRHGPPALRNAVADDPILIRKFAQVFNAPPTKLDATLAAHAADVLRTLLHQFPKKTADALYSSQIVHRLVQHVNLQPAAELLPRFIGNRVFTSGHSPVVPMHKRSIHMMATAKVHHLLLQRFQNSVPVLLGEKQGSRNHAAATIEGCCNAMANISMRAMCLVRKFEDVDERADYKYAANLGLITAHIFNDSKEYLNLLTCVQPVAELMAITFSKATHVPEIFLPTMALLNSLLRGLRKKRGSLFPSMRNAVSHVDTSLICTELTSFSGIMSEMLRADAPIVGRGRLALVDLIREACAAINEKSLTVFLQANNKSLVSNLLDLAFRFKNNEMLITRISQAFGAIFSRCQNIGSQILDDSELLSFMEELKSMPASWPALQSLVCSSTYEKALESLTGEKRKVLVDLEEFYDEHIKTLGEVGLEKGDSFKPRKTSSDSEDIDLEAVYGQSEDYGVEIYIRGLLQEVSGKRDKTPPSDNVVQHAAEAVQQAAGSFAERLNGRLLHNRGS